MSFFDVFCFSEGVLVNNIDNVCLNKCIIFLRKSLCFLFSV